MSWSCIIEETWYSYKVFPYGSGPLYMPNSMANYLLSCAKGYHFVWYLMNFSPIFPTTVSSLFVNFRINVDHTNFHCNGIWLIGNIWLSRILKQNTMRKTNQQNWIQPKGLMCLSFLKLCVYSFQVSPSNSSLIISFPRLHELILLMDGHSLKHEMASLWKEHSNTVKFLYNSHFLFLKILTINNAKCTFEDNI